MALPAANSVWPPANLAPAFETMAEHDAWYSGDVATLAALYSHERAAASQTAGRRFGRFGAGVSRLFWGKSGTNAGQARRTMSHMPLAADVAQMKANLLWAEPPTFMAQVLTPAGMADAPRPVQTRLDLLFNSPDAHLMLNESGETTSALGGLYYRVRWDLEAHDHVWVDAVDADAAVPEFRDGRLDAVNFWTTYVDGEAHWRHFERHERGAIVHALYLGTGENVGIPYPVQGRPETAWLADLQGTFPGDNYEVVIPTGIDRLTVTYEPNVRRNRETRKEPGPMQLLGRSDYQGIESKLAEYDEAWSSYLRDLKLGRARIFVAEDMLSTDGPGAGARFDEEQEVFSQLKSLNTLDANTISSQQFAIRWREHEALMLTLARTILRSAGLGSRDYDDGLGGNLTATGELRRDKREEMTRDSRKRYAAQATARIASVALELDGLLYPGKGGQAGVSVGVEFPAEAQIDTEKEARVIGLLNAARAISRETMIRRANPDWKEARVKQELERIEQDEARLTVRDIRPGDAEADDFDA